MGPFMIANPVLEFPSLQQVVSVSTERKQLQVALLAETFLGEPKKRFAWHWQAMMVRQ